MAASPMAPAPRSAVVPGTTAPPAPLGVGLLYNPSLPEFLAGHPDAFDYLEIIPEMFWTDRGPGADPRYVELESWVGVLTEVAAHKRIVAHNTVLSLGSADAFDTDHVDRIAEWHARYDFPWHSDHLSFVRVTGADGHEQNAGLAVPVTFDEEVLDLMAARVELIQRSVGIPFLIENSAYFITFAEQEMSEQAFLNRLAARTGCGLLLDLHNLYCNARNHRFDAFTFLRDLDLDQVFEIHIAGGNELGGMYTDSHAGPCPEPVWEMLDWVVPRTPSLAAITFEFHDSYYPLLKAPGILAELDRARATWDRRG